MFTSSNSKMIFEKLFLIDKYFYVCTYIHVLAQGERREKKKSPWIQNNLQNIILYRHRRTEMFLNDNVSSEA